MASTRASGSSHSNWIFLGMQRFSLFVVNRSLHVSSRDSPRLLRETPSIDRPQLKDEQHRADGQAILFIRVGADDTRGRKSHPVDLSLIEVHRLCSNWSMASSLRRVHWANSSCNFRSSVRSA